MKIACWSGPRNISTALMRSWSSREDTFVSDEPFYSYYLKEQQLKHPMHKEIIDFYPHRYNDIVRNLTSGIPKGKKYWYQKHMAHHMVGIEDFSWLKDFKNYFLIRHPKDVINSFIKKNTLNSVQELGYPQQLQIIEFLQKNNLEFRIINSDDLLDSPKKKLYDWCNHLNIKFDSRMLSWKKGPHTNDGIWGKHWYDSVYKTTSFSKNEKSLKRSELYGYDDIYKEALIYYKKIYNFT
jgi:hypothetical protein